MTWRPWRPSLSVVYRFAHMRIRREEMVRFSRRRTGVASYKISEGNGTAAPGVRLQPLAAPAILIEHGRDHLLWHASVLKRDQMIGRYGVLSRLLADRVDYQVFAKTVPSAS